MNKTILLLVLLFNVVLSKDLIPTSSFDASGGVTDLIISNNKIYCSTANSAVDIFNLETKEKIQTITVPKIKDFMGDLVESKIYSVDVLNNKILFVAQGSKGGRTIYINENETLNETISDKQRLFIAKAKFVDENTIIYALLSNQIFLYDLKEKKIIKQIQVSQSKFSNFVLTDDKSKIIIADESGNLKMHDTLTLELIDTFEKQNLDNVFQVDTKNGLIITAGQDRRSAIYSMNKKISYYKECDFLVYSAALSQDGKFGAFASNENNDVTLFDTNTKQNLFTLKENPAVISNIVFINNTELLISSDYKKINYYKLK